MGTVVRDSTETRWVVRSEAMWMCSIQTYDEKKTFFHMYNQ